MMKHIDISQFNENVFKLIGKDWMLITAGNQDKCNTMTASYGSFGILFGKPVAHIYVRPERYTYEFLEKENYFTLSFFNESYRNLLQYCGKTSGRDEDKINKFNLNLQFTKENAPYFKEAKLTIICKKLFMQDLSKDFLLDSSLKKSLYDNGGEHRMYVGEITDIFYQE